MNDADAFTVKVTTDRAIAKGAPLAPLIEIHEKALRSARARRNHLLRQLEGIQRVIEMREAAVQALNKADTK